MTKFSKQRFLLACGGSVPLTVLLENRETETKNTFNFEQPFILVGQHAAADIRLNHPAVGTRHIYLQMLDGRLFCLQLSNRSPLHWGGRPNSSGWIGVRDRIQFGPFTLSILDGLSATRSENETYPNPLVSSPNCISPICLENRSDVDRPFRGQVNRALSLLGSSSACKFRIHSDRVSSIHCGLVRTANGIWAVDLGGRGGIAVNSVVSPVARLEEGDAFEMGGVGFRIHYQTTPPEIASVDDAPLPLTDEPKEPFTPVEEAKPASSSIVVVASPIEPNESLALVEEAKPAIASIVLAESVAMSPATDREAFERMIGPVLEHFAAFQNQTFQQFQDLLNNMIQLMGSMFRDQLDSVREEMRRFDQISDELANLQKAFTAIPEAISVASVEPESPPIAKVAPPEPRTVPNANLADANLHLWLQSRIAELNDQRLTLWGRFIGLVRGKSDPT